jgi:hypothetical protein
MRVIGVSTDAADEQSERLRRAGQTIVFLAIDARLVRILAIGDPLKESTPAALQKELKQRQLAATRVRSVKNSSLLRGARSFALRTPQLSSLSGPGLDSAIGTIDRQDLCAILCTRRRTEPSIGQPTPLPCRVIGPPLR